MGSPVRLHDRRHFDFRRNHETDMARSLGSLPEEDEIESHRKESFNMDNSLDLMEYPPPNHHSLGSKETGIRKKRAYLAREYHSESGIDNPAYERDDPDNVGERSRRQRKVTAISAETVVKNERTYSSSEPYGDSRRNTCVFDSDHSDFKPFQHEQISGRFEDEVHGGIDEKYHEDDLEKIVDQTECEKKDEVEETEAENCQTKSRYSIDTNIWAKGKEGDSDDDSAFRSQESDSLIPESEQSSASTNDEEKRPFWDVFRIMPIDDLEGNERCYAVFRKLFKVLTIILSFVVTLLSILVTRGTVLFAASNLERNVTLQCKRFHFDGIMGPNDTLISSGRQEVQCLALPDGISSTPNDSCLAANNRSGNLGHVSGTFATSFCEFVDLRWVWSLFLMMITPYFLEFLRCAWIVCFRQEKSPTCNVIFIVGVIETLHVTGLCLMMFYVFPEINDVIQMAVIACGVAFVPSIFKVLNRPKAERFAPLVVILDLLSLLAQTSLFAYYPIVKIVLHNEPYSPLVWCVPLSLLLMSVGWWDNYIDSDTRLGKLTKRVVKLKEVLRKTKTKTYIVISLWKCVLALGLTVGFLSVKYSLDDIFGFLVSDCRNGISFSDIPSIQHDWVLVWVINTCTALIGYFFFRSAVKIHIQEACYAVPLLLGSPVLVTLLLASCEMWMGNACALASFLPSYLSWKCYTSSIPELFSDNYLWICALWWLSQAWITRQIWFPKVETLAHTDKLFMRPLYDAIMTEQWYLHNRRSKDEEVKEVGSSLNNVVKSLPKSESQLVMIEEEEEEEDPQTQSAIKDQISANDQTPMIYICATMWHETENEMIQILKSIFRLDKDQAIRRNNMKYLNQEDPDYYEFEAHIFFDNAFEEHTLEEHDYQSNTYVIQLIKVIDTAATMLHEVEMHIEPPIKYPTPYGGRLEWKLPGSNKLIAHLKDKAKIKIKKRWSQVMYMYYFLGYRLWGRVKDMSIKKKQMLADHTFLLALDGDVDFEPQALSYLVDLMKRNTRKLGAACGRIHPIGSGPMAWYQKFEYAMGHWMQKATEHVLGCVLCSPGCFSLFRGSALMDDNVMRMYATRSSEPIHYVQYDQGEDRWLCTLLLQQGYRVEYGAASDALTFCPENFNEFYNQRRRWMPSTMANIMDLLLSWRRTIKVNENISMLYIIYQIILFVSSILGAGTIFMMIVGAMQVAVNGAITVWQSFLLNLIPVILFIVLCFCTKSKTQLWMASILTILYSLVQMMVLVGIVVSISIDGTCSPTGVFFFYVGGTFILCAILHPQEFFCLVHGLMYFLVIPSMYMLLMIFSITNINDVSWGTRETVQTRTEKKEAEVKKIQQEAKIASKDTDAGMLASILKLGGTEFEDGFSFSIGNLWKCIWCPKPVTIEDEKLNSVLHKLDEMEARIIRAEQGESHSSNERTDVVQNEPNVSGAIEAQPETQEPEVKLSERDEMVNPSWIEDTDIGKGKVEQMDPGENQFFRQLIDTYLMPPDPAKLVENKKKEEKIADQLKELKNNMSLAYIMINSIFVVVVFTLQANVEQVNIPWPCGDDLKLEPIGMLFLVIFGLIMLLQTIGMLVHRMSTYLHIVGTTKIFDRNANLSGPEGTMALGNDLGGLKQTQSELARGEASTTTSASGSSNEPRPNVDKLDSARRPRLYERTIDAAYARRFQEMQKLVQSNRAPEDIYRTVVGRTGNRGKTIRAIATLQRRHQQPAEEISRPRTESSTSFNNLPLKRLFRKKSSVTQPPNPAGLEYGNREEARHRGRYKRRTPNAHVPDPMTPPADYDINNAFNY